MSAMIIRRILSIKDRERLKREISDRRRTLNGEIVIPQHPNGKEEGLSARRMGRYSQFMDRSVREDPALLNSQIRKLSRILENGSPADLSKGERYRIERKANAAREWLKRNMTQKKFYFAKSGTQEMATGMESIKKHEQSPEFRKMADQYKNCMRQIDPDNAAAHNIEALRPE